MIFQTLKKIIIKVFRLYENNVDYVYGAPLPKPLSANEERAVIDRFSKGDENARKELPMWASLPFSGKTR